MKKLSVFIFTCLNFFMVANANPVVNELPTQGTIVAGEVAVTQSGSAMQVQQTSQKAIINWGTFNIGEQASVHFQQPAQGIILNRINPNQGASQIYGKLTATGQVILVNSAGVFFGPKAFVNVGGIIASTSDISNKNFLAGQYIFDQPSSKNGSIINQGTIFAKENGLVALVGTSVSNEGLIQARMGNVILASGSKFTVSLNNNQLINFAVDAEADAAGVDPDNNKLKNAVNNSGTILADGGTVLITANSARHVVDRAINMSGVIIARSVSQNKGSIILSAGDGAVLVSGKLKVTGKRGGKIKILGKDIKIAGTSKIIADGRNAGGTILIGGNKEGKGPEANADNTTIEKGAMIAANALHQGDGGTVIVWGNKTTEFHGFISARGGQEGGNGGFVETSGHYLAIADGMVDARAPLGKAGTWLLDPADLTICTACTTTASFASNTYSDNGTNSNLLVTDLINALSSANIIVQTNVTGTGGNGDIIVNTPIAFNSANTLTLSAYRNITINSNISNTGGGSVVLRADNSGTNAGTVAFSSSNVSLSGGSGTVSIYYNPTVFGTPTTSFYTGGTSPIAYMLVNNLTNLQNITNNQAGNYALGKTIDATATNGWNSGAGFVPYSNFTGKFEGLNYAIQNLYINRPSTSYIGLFGGIGSSGRVSNLTLNNINFAGYSTIGGIAGANGGIINNVNIVGGNLSAQFYDIGGLVGNNSGTIMNSSTSASVSSIASTIGGAVGYNNGGGSLSNVSSSGSVTINGNAVYIGGLVGYNQGSSSISGSSSSGTITVTGSNVSAIGGLVGYNQGSSSISGSTSSGTLTISAISSQNVGGFVGVNESTISNSLSQSNLIFNNTGSAVGGFVGYNSGANISNSYSTGSITITNSTLTNVGSFVGYNIGTLNGLGNFGSCMGSSLCGLGNLVTSGSGSLDAYIGGFAGVNTGSISNVSSAINARGRIYIGGLVGSNSGLINNTSSSGSVTVTGSSIVPAGGLVGANEGGGSISNSSATGSVTSTGLNARFIGGFAGYSSRPISNSYSTGNVTLNQASTEIGGFVGYNESANATITNAYSTGTITITNGTLRIVGSFIGQNVLATLNGSGSFGLCTGSSLCGLGNLVASGTGSLDSYVGGLIGINSGDISNVSSAANVSGRIYVGGLIGFNSGAIDNTHSSGSVVGTGSGIIVVGGLIGSNEGAGSINHSSASGSVTSTGLNTSYIGGFTGYSSRPISNSYSTGNVFINNSSTDVGGFVGYNTTSSATITNAYSTGSINITNGTLSRAGGFVGTNVLATLNGSGTFGLCTGSSLCSSGTITASGTGVIGNIIGGFAGSNSGTLSGILSATNVTGTDYVGGLLGVNYGAISASQSSGSVSGVGSFLGGFVGSNEGSGSIATSSSSGNVLSSGLNALYIGGFVGSNTRPLSGSFSTGNVTISNSAQQIGGFIGVNNSSNANVNNVYSTGNIILTQGTVSRVGGLIGNNAGNVSNAYSTGNVAGNNFIGGLVGSNSGTLGSINGTLFSTGTVMLANGGIRAGGLVGDNAGAILNAFSVSKVVGNGNNTAVGGLIGLNQGAASVNASYSVGTVSVLGTGNNGVGGFVGQNTGSASIVNSYSKALVTGLNVTNIGGFAGFNSASISNAYSAAPTSGTAMTNVGGFAGNNAGTITNVFWDTDVTGQINGVGTGTATNSAGGCYNGNCVSGSANLFQATTYTNAPHGWDFTSVWAINNAASYPYLQHMGSWVIGGDAPVANQAISLATNGSFLSTTTVDANGHFNFILNTNSMANNAEFVAYLTGGVAGNVIAANLNNGNSITDLSIIANTIQVGENYIPTTTLSNTVLANAINGLSSTDLLYQVTGSNNLLIANATHPSVALNITSSTHYTVNGSIGTAYNASFHAGGNIILASTGITTTGSQIFDKTVTLTANSTLDSGSSAIIFNGTIDSDSTARNLTLTGSGTQTFNGDVGSHHALGTFTTSTGDITLNNVDITTLADQTFNGNLIFNNTSVLATNGNFIFNGTVSGDDLTLQSSGNIAHSFNINNNFSLDNLDIQASAGTNTLTVATNNLEQDWTLIGPTNGSLSDVLGISGVVTFSGMQALVGGNSADNFISNGSFTGSLDGASGHNQITETTSEATAWNIIGTNQGTGGGLIAWNNIESITLSAASSDNVFNIQTNGQLNHIDAGDFSRNNTINYTGFIGNVVISPNAATGVANIANINTFVGNGNNTTLSNVSAVTITATNLGTADSLYHFSDIGNVEATDFIFTNAGNITGNIIGNLLTANTINFSGLTGAPRVDVTLTNIGSNNGYQGLAPVIGGTFDNIDNLVNTTANNTLTGPAINSQWMLSSANSGSVTTAQELSFSGFTKIIGGAGNDHFILAASAPMNSLDGGAGNNTLEIFAGDSYWNITGNNAGNLPGLMGDFTRIQNMTGSGDGTAEFNFLGAYTVSGLLNGGNTLNVNKIDVSHVLDRVDLTLTANSENQLNSGYLVNALNNEVFAKFTQVQYSLGNFGYVNSDPISYINSFVKTGMYSGIVGDSFVFSQYLVLSPISSSNNTNDVARIIQGGLDNTKNTSLDSDSDDLLLIDIERLERNLSFKKLCIQYYSNSSNQPIKDFAFVQCPNYKKYTSIKEKFLNKLPI